MTEFNLESYVTRFREVCKEKFGRAYNFTNLEKEFTPVRTGARALNADDVMKLFNKEKAPFHRYWAKPDNREVKYRLAETPTWLDPSAVSDSKNLVLKLLQIFHDLGVVSLILRFAHPDRFGIFSNPIVHLLRIHKRTLVDLYPAFCAELHLWQDHFALESVAQTEMALWTFHELTIGEAPTVEAEKMRVQFDQDVWVQRRRAAQALSPFLERLGSLELARILALEHPELAGVIAGVELERLIRRQTRQLHHTKHDVKKKVSEAIDELSDGGIVTRHDARSLQRAWKTRDKAVHPDRHLAPEEVEEMLDTIGRVCDGW